MSADRAPHDFGTPNAPPSLEIERKFLLSRMPAIPPGAEVWRIEQGYLSDAELKVKSSNPPEFHASKPDLSRGRLRRTILRDGSLICTHTIKRGQGAVRSEVEHTISLEEFQRRWPRTAGRRLRKIRHRIAHQGRMWEIDQFLDSDLALAEVELPAPDAPLAFPAWLEGHIVREVTNDPAYTNASIARRLGKTMPR